MANELTAASVEATMQVLPLTPEEQAELEEREARMEGHIASFFLELAAIRKRRLYREHGTFEDYANKRWKLGRRRVDQLAAAGEIIEVLGTTGSESDPLPGSERQVRPLVALQQAGASPEDIAAVWREAVEETGGKQPASHVVERLAKQHTGRGSAHSLANARPLSRRPVLGEEGNPRTLAMEECAEACRKATHRILHSQALAADIYAAVMEALTQWDTANPRASEQVTVEIVHTAYHCQQCGVVQLDAGGPLYKCRKERCGCEFVADEDKEVECPKCVGAVKFVAERSCIVCKEGEIIEIDAITCPECSDVIDASDVKAHMAKHRRKNQAKA